MISELSVTFAHLFMKLYVPENKYKIEKLDYYELYARWAPKRW